MASPQTGKPPNAFTLYATTSRRLASSAESRAKSMSRIICCGTTRAPASLNMLVHVLSRGLTRLCRRPVRLQATRWSPSLSKLQPQRLPGQRRMPKGSAILRRRRKATWNREGRRVLAVHVGSAVSHAPAPDPELERSIARQLAARRGMSACSLKRISRTELALNCQPWRHSPGSAASSSSSSSILLVAADGRAPARSCGHEGLLGHSSSSRSLPACSASCKQAAASVVSCIALQKRATHSGQRACSIARALALFALQSEGQRPQLEEAKRPRAMLCFERPVDAAAPGACSRFP